MIIKGVLATEKGKKGLIKVFESKKTHKDRNTIIIVLEEPFLSKHCMRGKIRPVCHTKHIGGKRISKIFLDRDFAGLLSAAIEKILES